MHKLVRLRAGLPRLRLPLLVALLPSFFFLIYIYIFKKQPLFYNTKSQLQYSSNSSSSIQLPTTPAPNFPQLQHSLQLLTSTLPNPLFIFIFSLKTLTQLQYFLPTNSNTSNTPNFFLLTFHLLTPQLPHLLRLPLKFSILIH